MSGSAIKKTVYKEFLNKRTQTTIWEHFLRADDGQSVLCKHCNKILKTPGGATGALHTHMRAKHIGEMTQEKDVQVASTSTSNITHITQVRKYSDDPPQKKIKLTDYFSSELSMELILTRMAALDGIPLSKFCTSEDLKYIFKKAGYDLPKSPSTITKIILEQTDITKNKLKKQFKIMKARKKRFTLTFDEWTSSRNRRYMNINVHNKDLDPVKYKNLGLVRIKGSMPAHAGTQLLQQHLSDFDLNLKDIVAFTTDGASVMIKMGKNFDGHHQLCFAHGIQLAVLDVLYKTQKTSTPVPKLDDDASDSDAEDTETGDDGLTIHVPQMPVSEFLYKDTIEKLRKLVKSFKKSPLKNDLLQKYSVEEFGKTFDLILDCKTRWNSLSEMIGRFLKLKTCISKSLLDLNSNMDFTDKEIQDLHKIHDSLDIIKTTVMALCRRDSNLLTADAAPQFMLNKLDTQANELSGNLSVSLRRRIKERRSDVSGVLQYLHNNEEFFGAISTEEFSKPTTDYIRTFITNLLQRLKFTQPTSKIRSNSQQVLSNDVKSVEGEESTVAQQLDQEINKMMTNTKTKSENMDLESIIRVEMCIYDSTGGGREVFLTAAYNYLLSIAPTSIEAERAFSSAGYFCSKLRSSLNDKTLHSLSFMRSHFQEKICN